MTKQTAAPIASLRIVRKRGGHLGKSQLDFVQMGRDYELSRVYPGDSQEYVYLYAKKNLPRDTVFHARVPKNHQDITQDITDPSAYEYFLRYDGENAIWTDNVLEAYEFSVPAGYFHSAWLPSVAYNPGLNVFIKMDGGRQGGNDASGEERRCQPEYPSRLRLSWAPYPWGPWTVFHDDRNWVGDDPGNSLYQPKLVPKFTSRDGRTMYMFYSDCREDWGRHYLLNQQRLRLEIHPIGHIPDPNQHFVSNLVVFDIQERHRGRFVVALEIRVVEFCIPGIIPVESHICRRAEITKFDNRYRLVIGDEADGHTRPACFILRRNKSQRRGRLPDRP